MDIEQYVYDLTESGDAIIAYTMRSASGGTLQVCNLGATILSWSPAGDIAMGSCVRGLRGMESDLWGGVRFSEMMWESRVEVNRVVMALSYECEGVGIMCEVVFDYDDDDTLEITYIASPDAAYEIDFTHKLGFTLGEESQLSVNSPKEVLEGHHHYPIEGAKRGILGEVATLSGVEGGHTVEILSSQATLYYDSENGVISPLSSPCEEVEAGGRYIQKSLYRIIKNAAK